MINTLVALISVLVSAPSFFFSQLRGHHRRRLRPALSLLLPLLLSELSLAGCALSATEGCQPEVWGAGICEELKRPSKCLNTCMVAGSGGLVNSSTGVAGG